MLSCLSTGPVLVLSHFMSTRMIAYAVSRPRRLSKSFIPKISNACFKKTKRRQKTSTKQPAHPKKKLPFNKNACFRTEDERRNGPGRRYIVSGKNQKFPRPKTLPSEPNRNLRTEKLAFRTFSFRCFKPGKLTFCATFLGYEMRHGENLL